MKLTMKTIATPAVMLFMATMYLLVFHSRISEDSPQFPLIPLVYLPGWVAAVIIAVAVVISRKLFFAVNVRFHGSYTGFVLMSIASMILAWTFHEEMSQTYKGVAIIGNFLMFILCAHFAGVTAEQDDNSSSCCGICFTIAGAIVGYSIIDHRLLLATSLVEGMCIVYILLHVPREQRELYPKTPYY